MDCFQVRILGAYVPGVWKGCAGSDCFGVHGHDATVIPYIGTCIGIPPGVPHGVPPSRQQIARRGCPYSAGFLFARFRS